MVETGEWTIQELLKYLLTVRSTLQPTEIEILQLTPAFFEESAVEKNRSEDGTLKEVQRLKASDLYEPLNVLRSLGLPVIDWRGTDGELKWKHNSEEGTLYMVWPSCTLTLSPAKFLFKLGLRRYPTIDVVLGIAAGGGPQGTAALDYFLDNYSRWYTDYTANQHGSIAFVPAIHRGEKKLVKPLEVFSNLDWQSLGFPILDPTLTRRQDAMNRLKIEEHPPTKDLVHLLETSPPTTKDQACEWFGVLSRRILGLYDIVGQVYMLIFTRLPSP